MDVVEYSNNDLVAMAERASLLESCMIEYKEIETEYKMLKKKLYDAMFAYGVRQWITDSGTKITLVDGKDEETVTELAFDTQLFSEKHPKLYKEFMREETKTKPGRAGYVRITFKESE